MFKEADKNLLFKCLEDRLSTEKYLTELLTSGKPVEKKDGVTYNLFSDKLKKTICLYSLGKPLTEIREAILDAIQVFSLTAIGEATVGQREQYYKLLTLVSLSALVDVPIKAKDILAETWANIDFDDALIDCLLGITEASQSNSKKCAFEAYQPIYDALWQAPEESDKLIRAYVKAWYKNHRGFYWHNAHKRKQCGYSGYWSFEAAAILQIKNIAVSNTSYGRYLPSRFFGVEDTVFVEDVAKQMTSNGRQIVSYPRGFNLRFSAPADWINESTDRISVLSANKKLEIACTVFNANEAKSLSDFAAAKFSAIRTKMPWYDPLCEPLPSVVGKKFDGLMYAFEGVWPQENVPTYYLVYSISLGEAFANVTFTCLSQDYAAYKEMIVDFIESIHD